MNEENWSRLNYFNYYTEIEEHFQQARGSGLFLLSPLDWALVETWKNSDVPLEAVLRGIDAAFAKWRAKKSKTRMINGLAWCAQAVLEEAQIMAGGGVAPEKKTVEAPFTLEELKKHLSLSAADLRAKPGFTELAESMERLLSDAEAHYADLEQLEQRLTAMEEKMVAIARAAQKEEELLEARRELEAQLRPYRGKMSAPQIAMLEKQYLDRRLLEHSALPRLSLFYLRA